jgi:polyhydroxybutyrate depolymerase
VDAVVSLDTPAGPRPYRVHAPPGWRAHAPLPVVVMLHGAGGTALWTLQETGWDRTADRAGFLVVLPEGTRPDPTRPPTFLHNAPAWNDGSPRGSTGHRAADDVAFIEGVLDDVARRYPTDPARVYAAGFSNGAGMVFRLGAELSGRFAALAPVAGYCWLPDPRPARALPTLYMVGSDDPLVPLDGGVVTLPWGKVRRHRPPVRDTLARWARALGCPPGPVLLGDGDGVRVERYGPGRDGAELLAYTIAGLGHHWPGGRGRLSRRLAGPPSDSVRANDVLWDFFARHPA